MAGVICPGSDRCDLKEHKGYDTCDRAGRCQAEDELRLSLDSANAQCKHYAKENDRLWARVAELESECREARDRLQAFGLTTYSLDAALAPTEEP